MNEPVYENLTALGLSGVAFDGVWAIAVALDIASKKILSRNESGCENVPGDLVPLEQFDYTNMKLGCILRQSFSEVNFLGVTVRFHLITEASINLPYSSLKFSWRVNFVVFVVMGLPTKFKPRKSLKCHPFTGYVNCQPRKLNHEN